MLGRVRIPKYLDLGSPIVDFHINENLFPNTLIYLEDVINVMTKETILKLNLQGSLRNTSIMLRLADRSIVAPEGII